MPLEAELLDQLSDLLGRRDASQTEFAAWLGGTAAGGPNGDGTYPLTDSTGFTRMVACPARLYLMVQGRYDSLFARTDEAQAQSRDWLAGTRYGGPFGDGRYPVTLATGQVVHIASPARIQDDHRSVETIVGSGSLIALAEGRVYATAAQLDPAIAEDGKWALVHSDGSAAANGWYLKSGGQWSLRISLATEALLIGLGESLRGPLVTQMVGRRDEPLLGGVQGGDVFWLLDDPVVKAGSLTGLRLHIAGSGGGTLQVAVYSRSGVDMTRKAVVDVPFAAPGLQTLALELPVEAGDRIGVRGPGRVSNTGNRADGGGWWSAGPNELTFQRGGAATGNRFEFQVQVSTNEQVVTAATIDQLRGDIEQRREEIAALDKVADAALAGIGPVYSDVQGLTVTLQNGALARAGVDGRALGLTTPAGVTGANAAAGLILPIDATVSPQFAGRTLRWSLTLTTTATFTRKLSPSFRARYGISLRATIAGAVMTLTDTPRNIVTGAAATLPMGQPLYVNGPNGTAIAFVRSLLSGVNGQPGSTYELNTTAHSYSEPGAFTMLPFRFFNVTMTAAPGATPNERKLTIDGLSIARFVGDELFLEPYLTQQGPAASVDEGWLITGADAEVLLTNTANPGRASHAIAAGRTVAKARAIAASDAEAAYFFGVGDVLPASGNADQAGPNGAILGPQPDTITIPAGQSGLNSLFSRKWTFSGAANVGKRIRIRLVLETSIPFTRDPLVGMQVGISAAPGYQSRNAVIVRTVSGSRTIYTMEYVVQGDELALQPYVINRGGPTSATEWVRYESFIVSFLGTSRAGFTPADENVDQLKSLILSQAAMNAQASGSYAATVTVKADGSGDFTHPKLALDAIVDASATRRYKVAIYPGVYDGYAEWRTKDYVDLIGIGRREEIVIQYALPNEAPTNQITLTSTFWWDTISNLANLTFTCRNMRYACHCETNGQRTGISMRADNCVFIHYGNDQAVNNRWDQGSQIAIGSGNSDGQAIYLHGCLAYGPGGGFSYHTPNAGSRARPSLVEAVSCDFASTKRYRGSFIIHSLNVGAGDECRLIGNSFSGDIIYDDAAWDTLNPSNVTTNRAQISVTGHGNQGGAFNNQVTTATAGGQAGRKYRGQFADEERLMLNTGSAAIEAGSVLVALDNLDDKIVRLMTAADPAAALCGVAIEPIAAGGMGRVKVRGLLMLVDVLRADSADVVAGNTFSIAAGSPGRIVKGGSQGLLRAARNNVLRVA